MVSATANCHIRRFSTPPLDSQCQDSACNDVFRAKNSLTMLDSPMKTDWWVMASPATPGNSHHAFRCKGQYLLLMGSWPLRGPFADDVA